MAKGNTLITVIALVGLVIAVLVLAFRPFGPLGNDVVNNQQNTISATGKGTVEVFPDEAVVYLVVDTLKSTAEESKDENARISSDVLDSLRILGIAEQDIETLNYNIYPEYDWGEGKQTLKGYRTSNTLKVSTTDFALLGQIIDSGINAGVTQLQNIQFELSDEKEAETKKLALEKASKDAREKAEATAKGLGVSLGKIVTVSTSDYSYQPYLFSRGGDIMLAAESVKAAPEINPQELENQAIVTVTFEID